MDDMISRQAAIDRATKEHDFFRGAVTVSDKARRDELLNVMCWLGELPPAQPEKLTDIEQRIFLAAMSKEEKVCREVDKEPSDADCINLMRVCKSIERKVKGALWT